MSECDHEYVKKSNSTATFLYCTCGEPFCKNCREQWQDGHMCSNARQVNVSDTANTKDKFG